MNKKKKTILIVALLLVVFIGSLSYALWSVTLEQTGSNVVKTGCFTVDMVEETDEINLPEEYPVLDSEGKTYTPFTFTIQNTCTIDSSYSVNLDVDAATTLEHEYVKVALNNDAIRVLTDYEKATNEEKYQLTTGTLAGASSEGAGDGESVTYNLRLWLDQDTPETQMSKDFIAKVVIENITTSDKKELLSTVDYSKTASDDVTLNYYSDGSVEIVGSGEMDSNGLLTDIMIGLSSNEKFQDEVSTVSTLSETSQGMINAIMLISLGSYKYSYQLTGETIDLSHVTNNEELYAEAESLVLTSGMIPEEEQETVLSITKTLTESISNITSIKIEEGITNIDSYMFECVDIDTLRLPSTILKIGQSAFEDSDLEVVLNEGLEYIDDDAFRNSGITSITLPSTLKSISYYGFANTKLKSLVVPSNVNAAGNAFANNAELETVIWNSTHGTAGGLFANTPKLTSVVINSNIPYIIEDSFDNLSVNPNLVLKFKMTEDQKESIKQNAATTEAFDFTNYNVIWGYTE